MHLRRAAGLNNSGTIVGDTRVADDTGQGLVTATIWRGGTAVDLNALVDGLPAGVHLQLASDISDAGLIVGQSCTLASDCSDGPSSFALVPVR